MWCRFSENINKNKGLPLYLCNRSNTVCMEPVIECDAFRDYRECKYRDAVCLKYGHVCNIAGNHVTCQRYCVSFEMIGKVKYEDDVSA